MATIRVKTNAGMILIAAADNVAVTPDGNLSSTAWDMRFILTRNKRYTRIVTPQEVASCEYIA